MCPTSVPKRPEAYICPQAETNKMRKARQKDRERWGPTEPKWGLLTNHSAGSPICLLSPQG